MKKLYILLFISSLMFSLSSCDKEDSLIDESVVVVEKGHQNDLDTWIYNNLTVPYNVEVKYKWDDTEIENKFHVTPPTIEKAQEFLEAYLNIWIKSYEEEATAGGNPDFLKQYMPKLLVLVGSKQFNKDGSYTLGLAEGGRKVTIFDVNNFGVAGYDWDSPEVKLEKRKKAVLEAFHVVHHEFAHIMHQTKFYPLDFKEICKGDYTGNWIDVWSGDARLKGFITPYAMSEENEDFVETVAGMLDRVMNSNVPLLYNTQLRDENGVLTEEFGDLYLTDWEKELHEWAWSWNYDTWNKMTTPEAVDAYHKFNAKVDIATTYYKEIWGIDLYSLQKRLENAVNEVVVAN
ncbi:substrate import-associated zinc metallohydrolase lipoprotein [Marinifilum fragile]|uniref:substrate import-associated zinc metallohydrolase lipoprotein n=1 Tax=Marinifilum fragile TaxID=570161 RepID=UPI002AAB759F|nr:substrate import-associated zinc metallohydrolase lipoprotein [Marinifilum fragile]